MRLLAALLSLALLSSCGSPREEDKLTAEAIEASRTAPEKPDIALSNDPEPEPAPVAPPTSDELENGLDESDENGSETDLPPDAAPIPAAFRGRWGMSIEDCMEPRRPGSLSLLISANRLELPEGEGVLFRTLGNFPERYVGIFNYVGDRGRWSATEELALTGSSNVLVRQVDGGVLRYRRCVRTGA